MKETILEIYDKFIQIGPEYEEEKYKKQTNLLNKIYNSIPNNAQFRTLSRMLSDQSTDLVHYYTYQNHSYWDAISGKRVLTNGSDIFAVLDLWWPSENYLFEITKGTLSRVIVLELLKEKFQCTLSELPEHYHGSADIIDTILPDFYKLFGGQEFYCFFMGDPRNGLRKRPIKIRKVRVVDMVASKSYYNYYFRPTFEDAQTKQRVYLGYGSGWHFYLTKEQLKARLDDLSNYWMKDWDKKVEILGKNIKNLEDQLKARKQELHMYQSSIADYNKSIKNILWKDYSTL